MRVNRETVLVGSRVVLVPYRKEHVPTYHQWMKDPLIQEQTASEPLSLQAEYEMQRSWAEDQDKLTFIILSKGADTGSVEEMIASSKMVGDVNIFLNESVEDEEAEVPEKYDAECEIMIAESSYRNQGLGREALHLLISYVTSTSWAPLPIPHDSLTCKISLTNERSIRLFSSLGFSKIKVSQVWQEVEMRLQDLSHERKQSFSHSLVQVLNWPIEE